MTKPSMPTPVPDDVQRLERFRARHAPPPRPRLGGSKPVGAKPTEVLAIFEAFLCRLWANRSLRDPATGGEPSGNTVFDHVMDWAWDGCLQGAWESYVSRLTEAGKREWTARLDTILAKKDGRATAFWFHALYKALTGRRPAYPLRSSRRK